MKKIDFNRNWTCRCLTRDEEPYSVTLPHDAMRSEPRTAESVSEGNSGWYLGGDYEYTKHVFVPSEYSGKKVLIEVTDHGDGIPPEKLEYIWDRYYKVDKEHKRGVIGTGLGLSIVKGILDSHKARYGVRSTLGKGSTFWFELDIVSVKKRNKKNSDENKE